MWSRTATDAASDDSDWEEPWGQYALPPPGVAAARAVAGAVAAASRPGPARAAQPRLSYSRSIHIKRLSPVGRYAAPATPANRHAQPAPRVICDYASARPSTESIDYRSSSRRTRWQDYVAGDIQRGGTPGRLREDALDSASASSGHAYSYRTARSDLLDESWAVEGRGWSVSTVGGGELRARSWWSAEDLLENDRARRLRRPRASSPRLDDDSTPAGVLYSAPYLRDVLAYLVGRERSRAPAARATAALARRAPLVDWLAKLNEYLGGSVGTLQASVQLLDAAAARLPAERPAALAGACYWLAAKQAAADARDAACVARHAGGAFTRDQLLAAERRAAAALRFPGAPLVAEPHVEALCAALGARDAAPAAHHLCCVALSCARLAAAPPSALAAAAVAAALDLRGELSAHWDRLLADEPGYYPLVALGSLSRQLCARARALAAPASACREMHLLFAARRPRDARLLRESRLA